MALMSQTRFKILNREYSQKQGREELFERQRHKEPEPAGWHSYMLACAELEEGELTSHDLMTSSISR